MEEKILVCAIDDMNTKLTTAWNRTLVLNANNGTKIGLINFILTIHHNTMVYGSIGSRLDGGQTVTQNFKEVEEGQNKFLWVICIYSIGPHKSDYFQETRSSLTKQEGKY